MGSVSGEPFDASDPEQVSRAEAAAKLREEQRRHVAASLLTTVPGREWLWALMSGTGILKDREITDSAYANGFSEGMREVGLSLMRLLARSDPANFATMFVENDHG